MKGRRTRIIVALLIVAAFTALRLSGLDRYLSLESLKEYRGALLALVSARYAAAVLVYIAAYIVATALSVPGAAVLTLAGGFAFGLAGVVYVNIGATTGAFLAFLAARFLLGDWLQGRYGDRLERFNREMEENGRNYLLTLRLLPVFPFFLINILAGLTRVSAVTFLWTTALGIIPGSFAFIYAGMQLGTIERASDILSPRVLLAFALLGALALIPVAVRKIQGWRKGNG